MKRFFFLLLAGILLLFVLVNCNKSRQRQLKETFLNPPLEFRMNQNFHEFPLEPSQQDSLIREILENGWGGFALNTPNSEYLTDKGLQATRRFCEAAKAKGMDLWLYDEQGYPSGNAGDRVIKENPSWECMGLYMKDTTVFAGENTFLMPWGEPVLLEAFPVKAGKADYSRGTDLMDLYNGPHLKWDTPDGQWKIFAVTKYRLYEGYQAADKSPGKLGAHYPSLMIPEVTKAFLRITHEKYAQTMGSDLGRYFTSTFTDEPSLMALQFHSYKHNHAVLPWQEVLSQEIKDRYGYRPEEKLKEIYFDDGPEGQKIRYQYFHTVGDLFSENYFGQIREWCEEHQFKSGGHLLLEESMIAHAPLYGDIMKCFRSMHAPGIDILSCLPDEMPVHTPKLASSAAELTGQNRVMSEPCPVADRAVFGKETPPELVRGHLNMLLQGGITDFNCYLRLSNSDKEEKNEFNTYTGRIGLLLRGGYTASHIGVVYPIESLWTEFMPRYHRVQGWKSVSGARAEVENIDRSFRDISRFMFENRWEYTHLDARAILDSEVQGDRLVHQPLQFKVIVLPSVTTLHAGAWSRLTEYIENGGKVIALEKKPVNTHEAFPDPEVHNRFEKYFEENEQVVFLEHWTTGQLNELLAQWVDKPLKLGDETLPLRLAHKIIDGEDVVFVINDSDQPVHASASFSVKGKMEEWDPASGAVQKVESDLYIDLEPWHGKIYKTY